MKLKKLLLIIGIILLIYFLVCIIFSVFANREIFYTYGSMYGKCKIFENGKMIIEDKTNSNTVIFLKEDELRELKELIIADKGEYSSFVYPTSNTPGLSVDKIVWSYGYYYNFLNPFYKNTVYDGESSNYVFDLLEIYCNN